MRHVHASASLNCASTIAESLIPKFFDLQKDRSGAVRMTLEVPLDDFGLPTHVAMARDVEIHVVHGRDDDNLNDIFRVAWHPAGGGPFPDFKGTLVVWSEEDPTEGFIELDGEYEPPATIFGEAFDAAIGHLIVERTAKHFLDRVADGVSALRTTNA